MMDDRPFHIHGRYLVPCSDKRHKAIRAGLNPHRVGIDREGRIVDPFEEAMERLRLSLFYTRVTPDGVRCACCKHLFVRYS